MRENVFPTSWRQYRLADVATIQTGLAKGRRRIQNPVERPYLRVANVQAGHLNLSEVKTIQVSEEDVSRYSLRSGDVLLTEGGDADKLGRGTLWRGEIEGCLHQNHVFVVRPNSDVLLPQYLVWLTNGPEGRRYFAGASKQSTNLASINSTQLKQFPFVLPPICEQKAVAGVLETWENGIRDLRMVIGAKRRLKRGLMQQLLTGKRRFEEFAGLPRREHRLGELFTERRETGRADLRLLAITADRGVVPREAITRKDTSPPDKSRYKRIAPGDIGYNTMRMWQGVSAVSSLEGIVSPAYTVCVPREGIDPQFMGYLFKYPPMIDRFRRYSQGLVSDTLNLKFHHFSEVRVTIPDLAEQRRIGSVLSCLDREIARLQELRRELGLQKRGLLEKLLTGEVRVKS